MRFVICLLIGLIFFGCTDTDSSLGTDTAFAEMKSSPFASFDFAGDRVQVGLDGTTYQLLAMDTVSVEYLRKNGQDIYQEEWIKRFSEDFVEMLHKLDLPPRQIETFTLLNAAGDTLTKAVEFTSSKREQAKNYYSEQFEKELDPEQVLTRTEMIADIDFLHQTMQQRYAYYSLKGLDVPMLIEQLETSLPDSLSVFDFSLLIAEFINRFGDGHSRIRNVDYRAAGVLPFRTSAFNGRVVCHLGTELVHPDYPYLASINGVPVAELLQQSAAYFSPQGAPQFRELARVGRLSRIGVILQALNAYRQNLDVVLADDSGQTTALRMQLKKPVKRDRQDNPFLTKELPNNIGYLQISRMSSSDPPTQVTAVLDELADAAAYIIDVRDNGGGSRDILLNLLPSFISEYQDHLIGNVAFFRSDLKTGRTDYLEDRYLYPLASSAYSATVRQHISDFMDTITLHHDFDRTKFTEPHFLYISGDNDQRFQGKPVVVLQNSGCFSATDIFLSSFDQLAQATLIGTKSGGGSGRARSYVLPHSAIEVSLSSIMSFQGNGHLFDNRGVYPDIEVLPATVQDVIGATDHQLDYAVRYLQAQLH